MKEDQISFTDEEIAELKKVAKDMQEKEQRKRSLEDLNVTPDEKRLKIDVRKSMYTFVLAFYGFGITVVSTIHFPNDTLRINTLYIYVFSIQEFTCT